VFRNGEQPKSRGLKKGKGLGPGLQDRECDEQGRSEYKVLTKRLAINQFANNESQPKGDSALRKNITAHY